MKPEPYLTGSRPDPINPKDLHSHSYTHAATGVPSACTLIPSTTPAGAMTHTIRHFDSTVVSPTLLITTTIMRLKISLAGIATVPITPIKTRTLGINEIPTRSLLRIRSSTSLQLWPQHTLWRMRNFVRVVPPLRTYLINMNTPAGPSTTVRTPVGRRSRVASRRRTPRQRMLPRIIF